MILKLIENCIQLKFWPEQANFCFRNIHLDLAYPTHAISFSTFRDFKILLNSIENSFSLFFGHFPRVGRKKKKVERDIKNTNEWMDEKLLRIYSSSFLVGRKEAQLKKVAKRSWWNPRGNFRRIFIFKCCMHTGQTFAEKTSLQHQLSIYLQRKMKQIESI